MDPRIEQLKRALARPASMIEVGGFRPPEDPKTSWFGRVLWAGKDETWPESDGKPLWPIIQLNLGEAPFVPDRLQRFRFLTLFANDDPPFDKANGDGWCLRLYEDDNALVPVSPPETDSTIRAFPIRFHLDTAALPDWENFVAWQQLFSFEEIRSFDAVVGEYYDMIGDLPLGSKLGGWPSSIQHLPFERAWLVGHEPKLQVEYVFQLDCEPKANWGWAGDGCAYFGIDERGDWQVEIQMT
ncbi:MAG: DUF1963 domain-containing protein [Planctomycetota bacterium]